jgi:hypothetical protein
MSNTWQFYAIRSRYGWFIGSGFGAPGWGREAPLVWLKEKSEADAFAALSRYEKE